MGKLEKEIALSLAIIKRLDEKDEQADNFSFFSFVRSNGYVEKRFAVASVAR